MLPSSYPSDGPGVGEALGVTIAVLVYIAFIAFAVYMYMRVAKKAGWTLWHGLLILVPLANLVFLVMFVFMEWPVERRLRDAEARIAQLTGLPYHGDGHGSSGQPGYGYGYGAPAASPYGTAGHPPPGPFGAAPPAPPYPPSAPEGPPVTDVPPH